MRNLWLPLKWHDLLINNAPDQKVADIVVRALHRLIDEDKCLLTLDAHERSIAHRLAVHLEDVLLEKNENWDVDCEYNRGGHDPKQITLSEKCTNHENDGEGSRVFPDIIVHRRKSSDNFLAIELKKSTSRVSPECDQEKLRQYVKQLGYKHALFIELATGKEEATIDRIEWIRAKESMG